MIWIALALATDTHKGPAQSLRWIMRGRGQYQGIIEASGIDIKICVARTHCRIMSHKKGRLTLKYCDTEWKATALCWNEWQKFAASNIKLCSMSRSLLLMGLLSCFNVWRFAAQGWLWSDLQTVSHRPNHLDIFSPRQPLPGTIPGEFLWLTLEIK